MFTNLTQKKLLKKFRKIYVFWSDTDPNPHLDPGPQFHFRLDLDPQNTIMDSKHWEEEVRCEGVGVGDEGAEGDPAPEPKH